MIVRRPAGERGLTRISWLDSRHTFSFGDYHDPAWMGFRALRVINDDRVAPGGGFAPHSHRDMEILSWVLAGALEHEDSLGNGSVIRAGEFQRMTAGTGVTHSEFNPSSAEPARFLQIWILPERPGLAPGYEQRGFPDAEVMGRLRLVASRDGAEGSLIVHQDARVHAARLDAGGAVSHRLAAGRHGWVQVATGAVSVNGTDLAEGDGASSTDETLLEIRASAASRLLLFDLA